MQDVFSKRVAIIADQMISMGGADREMFSILKLFPNADIFTIAFNRKSYPYLKNTIHTSFVQKIPKPKSFYRHLKIFTPLVYESFDLRGYDLVISISAGPGKGVITGVHQPHIAMVMTPPRSLWDNELNVRGSRLSWVYRCISLFLNTYMRIWDYTCSKRVDYWTANSKYIARKIKKRYGVDSTVIYPGIPQSCFKCVSDREIKNVRDRYQLSDNFVLVVSRLYDYKRIDIAIRACINSGKELVIVGTGPDMKYLKRISKGSSLVKFLGYIDSDEDVRILFHMADALLFCGVEDFGLVPVESMAQGTPVIAYADGGVLETVQGGICGEFFNNEDELIEILKKFDKKRYNSNDIVNRAKMFTEDIFLSNLKEYIEKIYEKERV